MKQHVRHIIPCLLALLLVSCTSEEEWPQAESGDGEGSFSLSLAAGRLNAEVETRADGDSWRTLTADEAAAYQVTLSQEGSNRWGPKAFNDVTDRDRTQPARSGYVVSAESCSAEQAESANGGWGQPHYRGQSEPFEVKNGENTPVEVKCRMQNAGFCVVFDQSFTERFPTTYAVTTDDARSLQFNAGNAAVFSDDTLTDGQIAYYNMDADGQHTLSLVVTGADEWDRVRIEKVIRMEPGKLYRLFVRVGDEGEQVNLDITFDDEFDVQNEFVDVPIED